MLKLILDTHTYIYSAERVRNKRVCLWFKRIVKIICTIKHLHQYSWKKAELVLLLLFHGEKWTSLNNWTVNNLEFILWTTTAVNNTERAASFSFTITAVAVVKLCHKPSKLVWQFVSYTDIYLSMAKHQFGCFFFFKSFQIPAGVAENPLRLTLIWLTADHLWGDLWSLFTKALTVKILLTIVVGRIKSAQR